ncbi:DsbA family protein [Caulobacter mirabilis]|uniref:DsbA family protein n=1 Tax=Caulobacter mirabilis TaxID=69666 RepID=UPI001FE3430A|nr:DsbA family protein [Caulobacter mirabilis]
MTPSVDVFWSFRSPYSYLATPQLVRLREDFDLQIVVRPVLPIAVRIDGFFKRVNPLWPPYLARDIYRLGQMQGVPIRWPRPDPIVMDIASGEVPADQPYIHRLTRLGQAAAEAGRGLEYVAEVGAVIWSGAVDDWHLGDHLARAAERAGLDPGRWSGRRRPKPTGWTPRSPPISRRWRARVTGGFRPWSSTGNRSLDRIVWTCCAGVSSNAGCRSAVQKPFRRTRLICARAAAKTSQNGAISAHRNEV